MRRSLLVLVALCASFAFAGDDISDVQAIKTLHENDRTAHLKGDADLLAQGVADEFLDVGRGKFDIVKRDDFLARFSKVFSATKYSRWDDAVPPIVHIAPDGRSGWMAVQLTATTTPRDSDKSQQPADFQMAWLAVYEKHDGKWFMTAISYNVPPGR